MCLVSKDGLVALTIAHGTIVLDRLVALCSEAEILDPKETTHALGLVIDRAIVVALITRDTGVADVARSACQVICSTA
jgi:hypothetical protein